MLKKRKSQGLSVNLIIIVAIALVILVVVIAIFTGKMGDWVGETKAAKTCRSACEGIGMDKGTDTSTASACTGVNKYIHGTFGDITSTETDPKFCCCAP
jgi:uncharacterized protein YoxC|tara:strand:- start:258 stop:554 length:297 start_codon:yes stop_codon:yes gene_type:complete